MARSTCSPEYTGSLLNYYDKNAKVVQPDEVYAALQKAVPQGLTVLDKSAAEDKNSLAVTKETANQWSLKAIPDLAAHQADLTIGAPPEFKTRQQGLVGLKSVYNIVPKEFRPLQSQATVEALKNGQVKAANIFSTDPSIAANGFVVLEDPQSLFGSDNVVPLVRSEKADSRQGRPQRGLGQARHRGARRHGQAGRRRQEGRQRGRQDLARQRRSRLTSTHVAQQGPGTRGALLPAVGHGTGMRRCENGSHYCRRTDPCDPETEGAPMAKRTDLRPVVTLRSTAGTGYSYVTTQEPPHPARPPGAAQVRPRRARARRLPRDPLTRQALRPRRDMPSGHVRPRTWPLAYAGAISGRGCLPGGWSRGRRASTRGWPR